MFERVDTQVNFVHLEHEVMQFWEESDAFNLLRRKNEGRPAWSFLDGPITANNPMGVHHAWGRTLKDMFQRYFAMNGRELRYQNGFDCQGLWVELEVEREKGFRTKREIEDFGLDRFTEACKARVHKYSAIQSEQSKRLGYWMDWSDSYFTMSDENNYTIWGFLKKCHERGFLYKGTDVMPWSGRAGSAYSDMEVKEGRKLTTHTSVFVRFPLRGRENEYLLIWTTTPWTLTSNTGAAVNGELEYVKLRAKKDGALYYFAKDNLEFQRLAKEHKEGFPPYGKWPHKLPRLKTLAQIFKEQGGYEIEGTVTGSEMVGWTYDGPFDDLPAQQQTGGFAQPMDLIPPEQRDWPSGTEGHRVFDPGKDNKGNAYVVAGEGTGIVHSAPGCGDVDNAWGKEHQLVAIAPLDEDGKYIEGFGKYTGMAPTDPATTDLLLADMREGGFLVAHETYPHIYPHCWRTGDELVYRLVDEWFVSMDWRDEIKKTATMVNWLPPQMKGEERELDWLTTMKDWMISKKRYWGLALPIWECHACGHVDVIGSREELKERAVEGWEEFEREGHSPHRPYVDHIKVACGKCGEATSRIPDVGNPWLDAGIVAYSTTRYNQDREYWKRWVPADFITECFPGQFRNWFYAILAMSTMMEMDRETQDGKDFDGRRPPFRNLLGHALVMDEDGQAMHKSDGTAIWFEEAAEQIGVDTMRWMYCTQRPTEDLRFGKRHPGEEVTVEGPTTDPITHTVDGVRLCRVTSTPADEVRRRVLLTLWNSYAFFVNYARQARGGFDVGAPQIPVAERPDIDRWILSNLQLTVAAVREGCEKYEIAPACHRIERFIDDLSNWYIRRNRRRFYKGGNAEGPATDPDTVAAFQTLYEVLLTLTKLCAPVIPFVTEVMYRNLVDAGPGDTPVSVHLCDYPVADDSLVDEALSTQMDATVRLVSMGRSVRTNVKIGVRQPLGNMVVVPKDKAERAAVERFREQILEELNIKQLELQDTADFLGYEVKPDFKALGPKLGKAMKAVGPALAALDAAGVAAAVRAGKHVDVEIDGRPLSLSAEDIDVRLQVPDHLAVSENAGTVVALDTRIDDALRREGLAREVVRKLQDLRREIGLEIEDRIVLRIATDDADLTEALTEHADTIASELLATTFERSLSGDDAREVEVKKKPRLVLAAQIARA